MRALSKPNLLEAKFVSDFDNFTAKLYSILELPSLL